MAKVFSFVKKQLFTDGAILGIARDSNYIYVSAFTYTNQPVGMRLYKISPTDFSIVETITLTSPSVPSQIFTDDNYYYFNARTSIVRKNRTTLAQSSYTWPDDGYSAGLTARSIYYYNNEIYAMYYHETQQKNILLKINPVNMSLVTSWNVGSAYANAYYFVVDSSYIYSTTHRIPFNDLANPTAYANGEGIQSRYAIATDGAILYLSVSDSFGYRIRMYDITTLASVGYFGGTGVNDGYFDNQVTVLSVYNNSIYTINGLDSETNQNKLQEFTYSYINPPPVPVNLTAACGGSNNIELNWSYA